MRDVGRQYFIQLETDNPSAFVYCIKLIDPETVIQFAMLSDKAIAGAL
jgi:hypothetical protein